MARDPEDRLYELEGDVRDLKLNVQRHETMLGGEDGLDRLFRNFVARFDGQQVERKRSELLWRFVLTLGVALLVGLIEWHPWR